MRRPKAGRTSHSPTRRPTAMSSAFATPRRMRIEWRPARALAPVPAPTQEDRSDDDGDTAGCGARDLVDPVLRAVVPTVAVLREDARGGMQRLRHLQPHVPPGLLR